MWRPSAEAKQIRQHLLALFAQIQPSSRGSEQMFVGTPVADGVIGQLGEFCELRAVEGLRRAQAASAM